MPYFEMSIKKRIGGEIMNRNRIKDTLYHYLSLDRPNVKNNSDCRSEIDSIVDEIIDQTLYEVRDQILCDTQFKIELVKILKKELKGDT